MSRMGEYYLEEMNRLQEQEHQLELEQMEQMMKTVNYWWESENQDSAWIKEQDGDYRPEDVEGRNHE